MRKKRPPTGRRTNTKSARPDFARDDRVDRALALAVALGVISEATDTGKPADHILRRRLRASSLDQRASTSVAQAVFAWFRWRGFLGPAPLDLNALERTLALAWRFAIEPHTFDDLSLIDCSVPRWLASFMRVRADFVRAIQHEPTLWLRSRPGQASKLAASLGSARHDIFPALPDTVVYDGENDLFQSADFANGAFEIQDVASQAVGAVCAPAPGETWWDACAGEGGKTLHLADLMQNRGLIWASDRSQARLATLKRRAARAGLFNYRAARWQGGDQLPTRTRFDGVLVDAPCSGVGTWQRNPHARWSVGPVDVSELAAIQSRLLSAVAPAVKPGGRLVYAVCTLTRDETTAVAEIFSRDHSAFAPAPFVDPFAPDATPIAQAMWEPQHTRGNGMFVASWRRISH